jgi:hypothetical protein
MKSRHLLIFLLLASSLPLYPVSKTCPIPGSALETQINNINAGYNAFLKQLYCSSFTDNDIQNFAKAVDYFKDQVAAAVNEDKALNNAINKYSLSTDASQLLTIIRQQIIPIEKQGLPETKNKKTWKVDSVNFFEGTKALFAIYTSSQQ